MLAPGGRAGKYELREKLGQGTFGYVFTAHDMDLDRDVAFKVLNPSHQSNTDIVARFLQEARASARIKHPGIVTVLDCGRIPTSIGETAFIVMELLDGESLTNRLLRSGRLASETAVEICRQIASALEAAHRSDVLHRDLKPDNIQLVPDPAVPSGERVKVFDFGLAKLGPGGHTMVNTVFGTPRYMSPEQCRSATQIDHRSDIYSLGCIMFELITGRTPFDGDLRTLIEAHQRIAPPRAKQYAPDISPDLDELIAQMLAKDPNARPQSMAQVMATLMQIGALRSGAAMTMMPTPAHVVALQQMHQMPPQMAQQLAQAMPMQPQMQQMQQMPQMQPPMPHMQQPMQPMMRTPGADDSGVLVAPPSPPHGMRRPMTPFGAAPADITEKTREKKKKKGRTTFAAAAIAAFVVAAALTAIAARGRTKTAAAAPVPVPPVATEKAPAP